MSDLYCDQWENMQCSFKYFEQCMFCVRKRNVSLRRFFSHPKLMIDIKDTLKMPHCLKSRVIAHLCFLCKKLSIRVCVK